MGDSSDWKGKAMRKCLVFVLGLISAIAINVEAAEYRVYNPGFLTVGNWWNYDMTIYEWGGSPVNLSGEASLAIEGTSNIGGYEAAAVKTISPWSESTNYWHMDADAITKITNGEPGDNIYEEFINNDPPEVYPVWVYDTDVDRIFGHGVTRTIQTQPSFAWTTTYDTKVTYLGHETVSVPAGTFSCIKISTREDWTDSDDYYGYTEEIQWIDPGIGVIKSDTYEWMYDAYYQQTDTSGFIWQLTSTNVTRQPYCKVRTLPMDFTGDCRVNLADFAVFLEKWLDCQMDPPEACWE
jgi:hypothetical protein